MAHVETWRPYTSLYVGLVGLGGAALSPGPHAPSRMAAAWAIPTLGWLAGLYGGDYFDRELDAIAKPHRPIPSGRLRPAVALGCMIGFVAAGAIWTLILAWPAVFLVALALGIGLSYNNYFKARGLSGNLVRGLMTSIAFLFGATMTGHGLTGALVLTSLVFCLQDGASNLVGTLRDVDGDREGGYNTFPVVHGILASVRVIATLWFLWTALAVSLPALTGRPVSAAYAVTLALASATAGTVVLLLARQGARLSRQFALSMHEVLCLERIVLAVALIVWGAGAGLGAAVGVPALAITWISQRTLRKRHEFAPASTAGEAVAGAWRGGDELGDVNRLSDNQLPDNEQRGVREGV
jgi:4-hydroxybenzoate polyprenyltransferase/geranylgeranylglycerol-phosphate geranylgeranyltransferase